MSGLGRERAHALLNIATVAVAAAAIRLGSFRFRSQGRPPAEEVRVAHRSPTGYIPQADVRLIALPILLLLLLSGAFATLPTVIESVAARWRQQ
jgi:hypothetical protein